jgi:gliding motility-associated-like protein
MYEQRSVKFIIHSTINFIFGLFLVTMQNCAYGQILMPYNNGPQTEVLSPPSVTSFQFYDDGGASNPYSSASSSSTSIISFCPSVTTSKVRAAFTSFSTEAGWDALYAYDGDNISAPIIPSGNPATSSGFPANGWSGLTAPNNISANITQATATNSSGCLTFQFASDLSTTSPGWEATITQINASCTHPDKAALIQLYEATNGPGWNTPWDTTSCDVCTWDGITCNASNRVISLNLDGFGLTGTLPNINLPLLEYLNLSNSQISGNIPNFTFLISLIDISLRNNLLNGSIPNFSSSPNLRIVTIANTNVTGNIPSFSNASLIERIYIYNNSGLTGTIPNFINRPNLYDLHLYGNNLTGGLPTVSNTPNLNSLELYNNQLTGTIPDYNLPSLRVFFIDNNNLDGTLPNLNLPNLDAIRLNNNNLSGCFPASYTSFCGINYYNFSNNPLLPWQGDFSQFCSGGTQIGASCSNSATPGADIIQANCSCSPCTHPDKPALIELYEATNGDNWIMSIPWDTTSCDVCTWEGIACNGSNRVIGISLPFRNLSGNLPNLNLPNLEYLTLNGNQLSGSIPNFNLPNLQAIDLNGNQLTGNIPNFNLSNLEYLILSGNQLSGNLPSFNLPNLQYLYLDNNDLSGNLPNLNLPNLIFQSLEYNNLSGCFPASYSSFCSINNNFSNNPLLPWQGDFSQFCSGGTQIGASCSNSATPGADIIQANCTCSPCTHPDKAGLIQLYEATDGVNWTNPWDTTNCDVCSWFGVGCNTNGRVVCIDMDGVGQCLWDQNGPGNGLNGTIPNLVLPELLVLNLSFNSLIDGAIPNFSFIPKLETLQLFDISVNGQIPNFSNFPNLTAIGISGTNITGPLPAFSNLPKLRSLGVTSNSQLDGPIPNLSNRPLLDDVQLWNNKLNGEIQNITNSPLLRGLELYGNDLTGSIPAFILPNMEYLYLDNNQLSGTLPTLTLPKIITIRFNNNNLEGCFPASYSTFCTKIYNFSNNPLLPWQGDFSQFCANQPQIGAPCDNSATAGIDEIQPDCSCDLSCVIYSATLSTTSTTICTTTSTDLTFNFSGGTSPYDVVWSGGATLNNIDDGHTITVSPTTNTNYTITSVTDANGCTATGGFTPVTITVINIPATAAVSGAANVCQGTTQTYTTTAVANASSYDWIVPTGAVITSGQGTTSIVVSWPAGAESGDVCVEASNQCGPGVPRCRSVIVTPIPAAPTAINGPTEVCGSNMEDFSIDPVDDAASYTWTIGTGASIGAGQGSTDITANFSSSAQNGNLCVRSIAANGCGQSTQTCVPYTVLAQPVSPVFSAAPNTMPCEGSTVAYSVTPQPSVDDYQWDTQGAGTVLTGQGTNSVTIVWEVAGATTLEITANSSICANTATRSQGITVRPLPDAVQMVTGAEETCVGATVTYTADPVPGASTYTWEIPSIAQLIGNGTGNSISLLWNAEGLATFSVSANNSCGTGAAYFHTVVVNKVPAQPGTITGPVNVCTGSQAIFSIAAVLEASSYTWTVPAGASIVSGQGTTSVTVLFTSGTGGQVCVAAVNNCGSSATRCQSVTVGAGGGSVAGPITGTTSFCPVQNAPYSIANVAGATGYSWTVPTGTSIVAGQNTTAITVQWGTVTSGQVCVSAIGGCGAGTPSCTNVAALNGTIFNLGNDTTLCPGNTLTLNAGTGASAYAWNTSATTNTINVTASGTYTVTATAGMGNTCTVTDAIVVNFSAVAPPVAVTVLTQPATTTNVPVETALSWTPAAGCVGGYFISIGTTSGGTDIVNNTNIGNISTWQPGSNLPAGTVVFVTITPYNGMGNGGSTVFSFGTAGVVVGGCDVTSDSLELVNFYNTHNGSNWNIDTNWLVIGKPLDTWHGIFVNSDGCVTAIELADTAINGILPNFNLPQMVNLSIRNSRLQGSVPNFSKMPLLERLNLTDNRLDGLFPNFMFVDSLLVIDVDTNLFHGPIPSFNRLKKLFYLDLNYNQFDGGVPDFQLPALTYLDLNTNLLTGSIPNFTGIPKLAFLGLAENKLTGTIPNFDKMPLLGILYFNLNRLKSPVPNFDALVSKNIFVFDNNALTFDGMAYHINQSYNAISYAPQDSVFHDTLLIRNSGQNLDFSLDFDENVLENTYTWFKDGAEQPTQAQTGNNNLVITGLNASHAGNWCVVVSNPNAPDLELFSRKITLQIQSAACPSSVNFSSGTYCITGNTYTLRFQVTAGTGFIGVSSANSNVGSADVLPSNFVEISNIPLGVAANVTVGADFLINSEAILCDYSNAFAAENGTAQTIASSNGTTICGGGSTTLSVPSVSGASFQWQRDGINIPSANANSYSANTAGLYTVRWTPTNSCTSQSADFTLSVGAVPMPSVSANAVCENGTLTLQETSGNGANWQWSGPSSFSASGQTATRNNITAAQSGTYTVTVTNISGCTATATTSVSVATAPPVSISNSTPTCRGEDITLSVNGGSGWSWTGPNNFVSTAQNPVLINADIPESGTYFVTVTHANGCTSTDNAPINITWVATNVISTTSDCLYNFEVSANGNGTGPFLYDWADLPGNNDPSDRFQLPGGDYSMTVTDQSSGCTAFFNGSVSNLNQITATSSVVPANCGQSNGTINLNISGGGMPYTYDWADLTPPNEPQNRTNLAAGTYSVTVTETNGCIAIIEAVVTELSSTAQLSTTTTPDNCGQNTGGVNLTVTGGATPYTYTWSNNVTTQDLSDIPSGTYTVTVKDNNNCTASTSATVAASGNVPILSTTTTPDNCGQNTGGVNLTVTGGATPYTYTWSNTATTQDLSDIPSGTYTVTVKDNNNCTSSTSATVAASGNVPILSTTTTPDNCGQNTGGVNLTVTGGATPYTYTWSNTATTQDLSNIASGTYTVIVKDNNNCTASTSATVVAAGNVPILSTTTTPDNCGQNTGGVNLTVTGGATPYTYTWSNNATTEDLSNIISGTYTVTVRDNNNCTASTSATVGVSGNVPILSTTTTPANCGQNTGAVNLTVTGGATPYTYTWNNTATTEDLSNIISGTYTVTVKDNNNCTSSTSATVAAAGNVPILSTTTTPAACGQNTGAVNLTVTGGATPYTYTWNNTATTEDLSNIASGTYTVTVKDNNNCTSSISATVAASGNIATKAVQATICEGEIFTFNNTNYTQAGIYTSTITTPAGCDTLVTITLTIQQIEAQISATTDFICTGETLDITVSTTSCNGCTFLWSNAATTSTININSAATYLVTVTNNSGCTKTTSFQLAVEPLPIANIELPDGYIISCDTPSLVLQGMGGTSYNWSSGLGNTSMATVTQPGIYKVTVTNTAGCTDEATTTIIAQFDTLNIAQNDSTILQPESEVFVDILDNDTVNSVDEYLLNVRQGPIHCEATITTDKQIKLKAINDGFAGMDRLVYTLCDPVCPTRCDTATLFITILQGCIPVPTAPIPTGITPNGDGDNDIFDPIQVFLNTPCVVVPENASLHVYARNGECVFAAKKYKAWDGKQEGKDLPQGAYYFVLELITTGNKKEFRAAVNLVR